MRQLFTQPTVDARAVETLRQQMLAQHDQASKRMMQAMLDGSRVLTPEQRAKMADMAGQRRAMMERRAAASRSESGLAWPVATDMP
jgi:protein CpxP